MRRRLLLVLLLMTGIALADQKAEHAAAAAEAQEAQGQQGAALPQPKEAQAKTKPQKRSPEAQAQPKAAQPTAGAHTDKKEESQAQSEEPQAQPEDAQAQTDKDGKLISVPGGKALGMSILGNQEAPKALVIVPWKTSDVGHTPGISPMLDDSRQPVDKEVFMRALSYCEIRSEKKP